MADQPIDLAFQIVPMFDQPNGPSIRRPSAAIHLALCHGYGMTSMEVKPHAALIAVRSWRIVDSWNRSLLLRQSDAPSTSSL